MSWFSSELTGNVLVNVIDSFDPIIENLYYRSMTIQQLEYAIAIDTYRNFTAAAEACNVTQPTLSMQVRKLEDELGVVLFDRSRTPIIPTVDGAEIIAQARRVVLESQRLTDAIPARRGTLKGTLRLGIIPTVAYGLVPHLLPAWLSALPAVRPEIHELLTHDIIERLRSFRLDAALLATDVREPWLLEKTLYTEDFVIYTHPDAVPRKPVRLSARHLKPEFLWQLEDGHCMREHTKGLCDVRSAASEQAPLLYAAGGLDTLVTMVDTIGGFTILPRSATTRLSSSQVQIREFSNPVPQRTVRLVMHRSAVKERLTTAIAAVLQSVVSKVTAFRVLLLCWFAIGLTIASCSSSRTITPSTNDRPSVQRILEEADQLLGTSYCPSGSTPDCFDCSGFTTWLFANVGLPLPRRSEDQYSIGTPVGREHLQAGDLVFFSTTTKHRISHVGVMIDATRFVHASTSRGVMISPLSDSYWNPRYIGARRPPLP